VSRTGSLPQLIRAARIAELAGVSRGFLFDLFQMAGVSMSRRRTGAFTFWTDQSGTTLNFRQTFSRKSLDFFHLIPTCEQTVPLTMIHNLVSHVLGNSRKLGE